MGLREYKEGDRFGFCIYMFAVKPKTGVWKSKTCDDFVQHVVTRFKEVYGFLPDTIDVPEDYTGKMEVTDVIVKREAKPAGHYYAYVSKKV